MTKTFLEGISSDQFSKDDFTIWKWRWLTNLFGFQFAQGAKYFDSQILNLSNLVFAALEDRLNNPQENIFLETYLLKRATEELGEALFAGYQNFCEKNPDNNLVKSYYDYCQNPSAVTPTYVPAVLNNAFLLLKESHEAKKALSLATEFMCQFLLSVYARPANQPISYAIEAKDTNLRISIQNWLDTTTTPAAAHLTY